MNTRAWHLRHDSCSLSQYLTKSAPKDVSDRMRAARRVGMATVFLSADGAFLVGAVGAEVGAAHVGEVLDEMDYGLGVWF